MLQFKVVCFKHDVGIFTCYGAKVKTNSPTPSHHPHHPHHPHDHHIPCEPGFKDKVIYDVVLYTNPELSQSLVIYSDKNINTARLVLNNFIAMTLGGRNIIDLDKINDKKPLPLKFHECIHDEFDHPMHGPHPDFNPWDKNCKDPRHNPFRDVFDCTHDDPHGKFHPDFHEEHYYHDPHHHEPDVFDMHKRPGCDGDVMHIKPHHPHHCEPFGHHEHPFAHTMHEIERSVTRTIPNCLERILHEVTPPERRPENNKKIIFYYGNGGVAMGGSVITNLSEMSDHALEDMFRKNGKSTFTTSLDRIDIHRGIQKNIIVTDEFKINKVTDQDWAFFMIPDKFMKLIKDFNFYYQENSTDNTWTEVTDLESVSREFTIQSNGIRYYVIAMRINGNYAVKFAMSKVVVNDEPTNETPDDTETPDTPIIPDNYGTVLLNIANYTEGKILAISDGTTSNEIEIDSSKVDSEGNIQVKLTGLVNEQPYTIEDISSDTAVTLAWFTVLLQAVDNNYNTVVNYKFIETDSYIVPSEDEVQNAFTLTLA